MSQSLIRRLCFALATAVAVIGGAEAALRMVFPIVGRATMPPEMIAAHINGTGFAYDPDLGWYWGMLPSAAAGVDAHGFRAHTYAISLSKPPEVKRVITFGDSQTYGAGVQPDETWPARAEAALGPGWEVLNAGLSGYRSFNVLRLIKLKIAAYDPDFVVIDCMPFDSPRDDGQYVAAPVGWQDPVRRMLWGSRLYYALRVAVQKATPDRPRWLDRPARPEDQQNPGNLDLIAAWGKEAGVGVIFMQYAVEDDHSGRIRCQTATGELPAGHSVVPACDALLADHRASSALFLDNNHLTVEGNRVVGEAAAATIRAATRGPDAG
ncbi:hypothetical protein LBMAG42_14460 [Deltaproteobacteria bacterium]|nr:hypothetical protein LBMAG42_14460 [Deltaproteobacteria bacterium]